MKIEDAIIEDLAVRHRCFPYGATPIGGADWVRPDGPEIKDGKVFLRDIDCGHRGYWLPTDQYLELRKHPYSRIGLWSFVCEDDPAARLIAYAHSNPDAVARNLHEAREANRRLQEVVAWVESWVSNPVGSYSVAALDGLFGMTRDKIAALTTPEQTK